VKVLIQAAAKQWGVPAGEVKAENHVLTHAKSGRTLGYGDVAEAAADLALADVAEGFRLLELNALARRHRQGGGRLGDVAVAQRTARPRHHHRQGDLRPRREARRHALRPRRASGRLRRQGFRASRPFIAAQVFLAITAMPPSGMNSDGISPPSILMILTTPGTFLASVSSNETTLPP
jgi:hypothetical protein